MRTIAGICAVLLWALPAHATAIYRWQSLSGGADCCSGSTLELSDAAYYGGHAHVSLSVLYPTAPDPNTPVTAVGIHGFGDVIAEDFRGHARPDGSTALDTGYFNIDLDVVGDGLAGSVYVNNLYADLRMAGDATLWTIAHYATDRGGPCGATINTCAGQTGRWVLAAAPLDAPPVAALLLLGAGWLARRRA
jgi:uncharacterized protein (TIGR03382 family)